MSVASIVCVDGELDVHDTASAAVTAAIERRREASAAKIGIAVGDIELGDPLGLAKRLSELAAPGAILVSDTIRRAVARDDHAFVELGSISTAGYVEHVRVFELDGATSRVRTIVSLEAVVHARVADVGREDEDRAQLDAEIKAWDRKVWGAVFAHGGYVELDMGLAKQLAFDDAVAGFRVALALLAAMAESNLGNLLVGIERGPIIYLGDRWGGRPWLTARRIRRAPSGRIACTMTAIEAIGAPALAELGLVIEVVEEVVQRGIRDPVRVAQLRLR